MARKNVSARSKFDAATRRGLDATYDLYCYLAGSTILGMIALPAWAQEGGSEATLRRLIDPEVRARLRDHLGQVVAVGTWFGLAHLVLFLIASSVVAFPFALVPAVPIGVVFTAVLLLTLAYFALVDSLHLGRLAGYVAILETPPTPQPPPFLPPPSTAPVSAFTTAPESAIVDQNELILSACCIPPWTDSAHTTQKTRAAAKLLTSGFFEGARRLVLFPVTPDGDVAKIESIPPRVHHLGIQAKCAFASYAGRRGHER